MCALSNASIDTTLCTLLLHAAAQMQILEEALKSLGKGVDNKRNVDEDLKECVKHYTAIIKWV